MFGHSGETAEVAETVTLDIDGARARVVARASENAKAKNVRLHLLKARNENYLAERNIERDTDDDETKEL